MTGRFRDEYDEIPRTEIGGTIEPTTPSESAGATVVSLRDFAKVWALHIMTVAVTALTAVVVVLIFTAIDLRADVRGARADLTDGQVRGCVLLAQNSDYFPPTCLDADVVSVYARDLIDLLDTTGAQGDNRVSLCEALEAQGVRDTDC